MSRAKLVRISKERVLSRLSHLGMLQKELADEIGWNRQGLNRALSRGFISEDGMDQIARALDLAPEYLSGMPLFDVGDPEAFYNYDFHVSQAQPSRSVLITNLLWRQAGINPEELSPEVFWGLWFCVEETADRYIKEHDRQP